MPVLALVALVFFAGFPLLMLRAWVITTVWGWYAVRLGLPPIHLAWAVGLSVLASLFVRTYPPKPEKAEGLLAALGNFGSALFGSIFYSLMGLFVAWVALQWM